MSLIVQIQAVRDQLFQFNLRRSVGTATIAAVSTVPPVAAFAAIPTVSAVIASSASLAWRPVVPLRRALALGPLLLRRLCLLLGLGFVLWRLFLFAFCHSFLFFDLLSAAGLSFRRS